MKNAKPAYDLADAEKRDLVALIQAGRPARCSTGGREALGEVVGPDYSCEAFRVLRTRNSAGTANTAPAARRWNPGTASNLESFTDVQAIAPPQLQGLEGHW